MVENVIRVLEQVFTLVVRQRPLVAVRIITASKEEVMSCLKMTLLYRMTERLPVTWPVPAEKFPLSNKKVFVFFLQENNHQKETQTRSVYAAPSFESITSLSLFTYQKITNRENISFQEKWGHSTKCQSHLHPPFISSPRSFLPPLSPLFSFHVSSPFFPLVLASNKQLLQ